MKMNKRNYLKSMNPLDLLRTKKVLKSNPTILPDKEILAESSFVLFEYDAQAVQEFKNFNKDDIKLSRFKPGKTYWLNIDVLHPQTIEAIGSRINLHPLLIEDILSENQRPKTEEIENLYYCVLHMLYFNEENNTVESEQVSFVLGSNFVVSFQVEAKRDLFDPIREKLKMASTRLRNSGADYLLYSMLDVIVDQYFVVMDKLALQIEKLEESITQGSADEIIMNQINGLRKEVMYFKRNSSPVRELLSSIIRSETPLIDEKNNKYFKDIYDHIIQANDLSETYRDVISNLRDLYFSQMNLKMNEVMKFLAIVTTLLAPATVLGGIFGMNFEKIPYIHDQNGFWIATTLMLIIPIFMLYYFRKKGWF